MHQRWRCVTPERVTLSANSVTGSLWPMACWLCFLVNEEKNCFGEQIVQHFVVYNELKVIFVCKLKHKDQMSLSYESRMFSWSISGIPVDRKYKTATKPTLFSRFMTIVPCRMPFAEGVCPAIQNMHSSCLRREEKKVLRDYLIFIILGRCWRFEAALIGCRARARGKRLAFLCLVIMWICQSRQEA